jgi:D-3-phosphoglycerate dehydrogenase
MPHISSLEQGPIWGSEKPLYHIVVSWEGTRMDGIIAVAPDAFCNGDREVSAAPSRERSRHSPSDVASVIPSTGRCSRMKILIGTSTFGVADDAPLQRLADLGLTPVLNPFGRTIAGAELPGLLTDDTIGLIAGLEPLDRPMLAASHLKAISRVGVGMSSVDQDAARDLGILLYSTPDAPTQAVAELALGSLLALLRRIPEMDRDMHTRRWNKQLGRQLSDRTVAIVGFGRIGRRLASLLVPFGTRILVVDPGSHQATSGGLPVLSLYDALEQADVVSIHVSGTAPILDREALAHLKRGSYVLNASRGGCIIEEALLEVLASGRVAGAWLDTFEAEPYDGPLCDHPNVLLTPHVGSNTAEARVQMEAEAVDNLVDGLTKAGVL